MARSQPALRTSEGTGGGGGYCAPGGGQGAGIAVVAVALAAVHGAPSFALLGGAGVEEQVLRDRVWEAGAAVTACAVLALWRLLRGGPVAPPGHDEGSL